MTLLDRQHWIFDLDGTLTIAVHDFKALKSALGLPFERSVLDGIATRPLADQAELRAAVERWEWAHVDQARAAPDAEALLTALDRRPLGVLTRNTRPIALATLEATGLDRFFKPPAVLGRACASPKPDPAGIRRLLSMWGADPSDAVMVGDWIDDLKAGRAAGVATVHIARATDAAWPDWADRRVDRLDALLAGGA